MISAKEANVIYLKAVDEEDKNAKSYLQKYIYDVINAKIEEAAKKGEAQYSITKSAILSQARNKSNHMQDKIIKIFVDTLEDQGFTVINPSIGDITIDWRNPIY